VLCLFTDPALVLHLPIMTYRISEIKFIRKKKEIKCLSNSVLSRSTSIPPQQHNPNDDRRPNRPPEIPPRRTPHLLPPPPPPRRSSPNRPLLAVGPPLGRLHRNAPPTSAPRKCIAERPSARRWARSGARTTAIWRRVARGTAREEVAWDWRCRWHVEIMRAHSVVIILLVFFFPHRR